MEEDIKNLTEIIELCEEELDSNDKNISATLDLIDLKSLRNVLKGYRELEKHISFYEKNGSYKKRIIELKEENEELKEQVEYLKHEVVLNGSTVEKLVREKMNSIPNSKITEKIEKLDKRYKEIESKYTEEEIDAGDVNLDDYVEMQSIQKADEVLQELIEGK